MAAEDNLKFLLCLEGVCLSCLGACVCLEGVCTSCVGICVCLEGVSSSYVLAFMHASIVLSKPSISTTSE